jgi:hypothetical protein
MLSGDQLPIINLDWTRVVLFPEPVKVDQGFNLPKRIEDPPVQQFIPELLLADANSYHSRDDGLALDDQDVHLTQLGNYLFRGALPLPHRNLLCSAHSLELWSPPEGETTSTSTLPAVKILSDYTTRAPP